MTNMKKSIFIWMGAMLMMTIGMCSCSDDDNDVVNPEEEEEIVQKDFFYYHMGDKIPLTLNVNNYCINIPKDNDKIRERALAIVRVLKTLNDETYEGYIVTRADYKKLTAQDFWKEDVKSVIVTPSYFNEYNKVVISTPYLTVKLKKEEDSDLLTSYAEKYKLQIVRQDAFMPLYYILCVTPESEKNPLVCANEIYESGDFASSQPDLVSGGFINTSGDIEEHEVSPEEIPEGALNQTTTEFMEPGFDGVYKNIHFSDSTVEKRPKTANEFFNKYIGKGVADCFKCIQHDESDGWGFEYYQQYYKDVIVKIKESYFSIGDGTIQWAVCYYLPIKDFDVTPKFNKWVAYEIFKSFMKLENYYEDRCELQIVCVPEGDSYGPRLAYEVKNGYEGLVIDARSGRALYRTSYDW